MPVSPNEHSNTQYDKRRCYELYLLLARIGSRRWKTTRISSVWQSCSQHTRYHQSEPSCQLVCQGQSIHSDSIQLEAWRSKGDSWKKSGGNGAVADCSNAITFQGSLTFAKRIPKLSMLKKLTIVNEWEDEVDEDELFGLFI